MTVCRAPIGYGNAHEELSCVLSSLSLPQVSLHSARSLRCHSWRGGRAGAGHPQGWGWLAERHGANLYQEPKATAKSSVGAL